MDSEGWTRRYATQELIWSAEPNRFLVDEVAGLAPGRALDLAAGEGRNAVWLARQRWDVTAIDFGDVGLEKARQLAENAGVTVRLVCADATQPIDGAYDLVVVLYLQLPADQRRQACLTIVRAEVVHRTVKTDDGERTAIGALVRAERAA
jgi:SAM-dependent methyltransferase